jgi:ABC-type multidrug transport system ATPase subunit
VNAFGRGLPALGAADSLHPLSGSSAAPAAVQAVGLAKRYGHVWALRGITLAIPAGQSVALLGPNGSGKSTLLRVLVSGARPTSGDVRVFGDSLRADGDAVRRRVGLLSDRPPLYDELTALENLKFAAVMYGVRVSDEQLRGTLAAVGLRHVAAARVHSFSQGMAQRLSLARTMLQDPDLLLLDEPYNALDAEGLRLVDQQLARGRAAGKTAILATHHIAKGLELCDRVIALRAGRVAFDGPTARFTASPLAEDAGAWA